MWGLGHIGLPKRSEKVIQKFYATHHQSEIQARLAALYPGVDFRSEDATEDQKPPFSRSELIDLYLREWRTGLSRWEERKEYGYRTDLYFPHTYRDRQMEWETRIFITRFGDELLRSPCLLLANALVAREDPSAVVKFFYPAEGGGGEILP